MTSNVAYQPGTVFVSMLLVGKPWVTRGEEIMGGFRSDLLARPFAASSGVVAFASIDLKGTMNIALKRPSHIALRSS